MLRLLYNFIFNNPDKLLTLKALVLAALARAAIRFLHMSRIQKHLGVRGAETSFDPLTEEQSRHAGKISYRVSRVANRTPWESKCLVRAITAQRLLTAVGIASTLYLGVKKDEEQKMIAHAWIRSGPYYITGGDGSDYVTVAKFARYPTERN